MTTRRTAIAVAALLAVLAWALWRKPAGPAARSAAARGPSAETAKLPDRTKRRPASSSSSSPSGDVTASDDLESPDDNTTLVPAVSAPPKATVLNGAEPATVGAWNLDSPAAVDVVEPPVPQATAMENLRQAFRHYASRLGGNPVGDNAEITAALRGANPRRSTFLGSDDGIKVNEREEAVDAWGTPYFFHQLSRTEMEIRSAGPDRRMWTTDDLLVR
jgi:hypothetical protein